MSAYEKPVNEFDFRNGNEPEIKREEEAFMYKAMQLRPQRPEKPRKDKENVGTADDSEDPELEAFVDKEIDAQMKRMGGGDIDSEEDFSDLDSD